MQTMCGQTTWVKGTDSLSEDLNRRRTFAGAILDERTLRCPC